MSWAEEKMVLKAQIEATNKANELLSELVGNTQLLITEMRINNFYNGLTHETVITSSEVEE